ncbi:MAG: HAD hydrolase family protein [Deinococcales bacterium]
MLRGPLPQVGDVRQLLHDGVIKLHFRHSHVSAMDLSEVLKDLPVYCTWHQNILLEVMAEGVNKARALAQVARAFQISPHEVAAFGDEHNDLEMIKWAGLGVAMGNANPQLKEIADIITLSNDEDGVSHILEHWL